MPDPPKKPQPQPSDSRYTKWDDGNRFGLTEMSRAHARDDSFGRGGCVQHTFFGSAEAREYYIQAQEAREQSASVQREYDWLREGLRAALKKRNIRKRILELLG